MRTSGVHIHMSVMCEYISQVKLISSIQCYCMRIVWSYSTFCLHRISEMSHCSEIIFFVYEYNFYCKHVSKVDFRQAVVSH